MSETATSSSALATDSLALFFDTGMSLERWDESGIIDRELAVYEELADEFDTIYLCTFGANDGKYSDRLAENIKLLPKRYVSNDLLYALLLPFVYFSVLRGVDIVKTNQLKAALSAVITTLVHDVSLVVRTGFVPSNFARQKCRTRSRLNPAYHLMAKQFLHAAITEKIVYFLADGVFTSSAQGYLYLEKHHWIRGNHIVLPNYIETDTFVPTDAAVEPDSICFVGRLQPQKNLRAFVRALAPLDITLTVVGSGHLQDELAEIATGEPLTIEFVGRVPNHELPALLNSQELFVLPSRFEGMPKVLLEAMSCGRPVVATDVMGSNEVVDHEVDGLLCETDPASIRSAVERLRGDSALQSTLGTAARRKICEHYSLDTVVSRERAFYETYLGGTDDR